MTEYLEKTRFFLHFIYFWPYWGCTIAGSSTFAGQQPLWQLCGADAAFGLWGGWLRLVRLVLGRPPAAEFVVSFSWFCVQLCGKCNVDYDVVCRCMFVFLYAMHDLETWWNNSRRFKITVIISELLSAWFLQTYHDRYYDIQSLLSAMPG